jgi:flagellar biosynthesis anti-sigma factor FlgM
MKIDPNLQPLGGAEPERVGSKRNGGVTPTGSSKTTAKPEGLQPASGEDTVSLSTVHSDVQHLTAALTHVPDVRTEKVGPLQQKVKNGQYKPDNEKLADALLSEQASRKFKA